MHEQDSNAFETSGIPLRGPRQQNITKDEVPSGRLRVTEEVPGGRLRIS
jgi:hypothetical protein